MNGAQPRRRGRRPKKPEPQAAPHPQDRAIIQLAALESTFDWHTSGTRHDVNQKVATVLRALLIAATHEDSHHLDMLHTAARDVLQERPITKRMIKQRTTEIVDRLLDRVDPGYSPWDEPRGERPQLWLDQHLRLLLSQCPAALVPRAGLHSLDLIRPVINEHFRADLDAISALERRRWRERFVNALLKKFGFERPDAT